MSNFDRITRRLEVRSRGLVAVAAGAIFVSSVIAAVGIDSGNPPLPPEVPPHSATTEGFAPGADHRPGIEGFSTIGFTIVPQDEEPIKHCGLLAETPQQLARGLMWQPDIGGYPAMLFRFQQDVNSPFYMANVPIPLSIAWFDSSGRFVSSAEMVPCEVSADQCPRYPAGGTFRYALEAKSGSLDDLGISDGSVIEVGGTPCS